MKSEMIENLTNLLVERLVQQAEEGNITKVQDFATQLGDMLIQSTKHIDMLEHALETNPTCVVHVIRNKRVMAKFGNNIANALDYIYHNEMCDDSTEIRLITNGNFVRDFWYGEFTRPQDYVKEVA